MILNYQDLPKYRKKVVMIDGCFDPLHPGHILYFNKASQLGYPLLCCVENDRNLRLNKKRPPLLTQDERVKVIDAIRYVSFTVCSRTETVDVLKKLQPVMYVKGGDWQSRGLPSEEKSVCAKLGIKIVYLDTVLDSSTRIVKRFARQLKTAKTDMESK